MRCNTLYYTTLHCAHAPVQIFGKVITPSPHRVHIIAASNGLKPGAGGLALGEAVPPVGPCRAPLNKEHGTGGLSGR